MLMHACAIRVSELSNANDKILEQHAQPLYVIHPITHILNAED